MRSEILLFVAEFEHDDLAVPVIREALREESLEPVLEARIHVRLAWAIRFREGFTVALEATRAALVLADPLDDDALRFEVLVQLHTLGMLVGDPAAPAYAARARDLAAATEELQQLQEASFLFADALYYSGNINDACAVLERLHREWKERDELFAAGVLFDLAWLELVAGRWELRRSMPTAHAKSTSSTESEDQDYIPITWVAVHRGELERARAESARALELCEEQIGFHPPLLQAVPGLVALWSGDAATAAELLETADRQAVVLGWGAPDARPWTADYVEALLELGRVDEAVRVTDVWEADATRLDRKRVLANGRPLPRVVAAAQGAVDEAATLLGRPSRSTTRSATTSDAVVLELALGVVLRRARQKRLAREAIEVALAGFEALGERSWTKRASDELGRIGGRAREDGLTAAERRVAVLVAAGQTNREVAASLFLGERTVAGHLTRVYAKLGVRSRTELARRLD